MKLRGKFFKGAPNPFASLCWPMKPLLLLVLVLIVLISTSIVDAQEFVRKWGSGGSGDGQFSSAAGIAARPREVYVADQGNHRIQVFSISVGP